MQKTPAASPAVSIPMNTRVSIQKSLSPSIVDAIESYIIRNIDDWVTLEMGFYEMARLVAVNVSQPTTPIDDEFSVKDYSFGETFQDMEILKYTLVMLGELYADRLYSANKKKTDIHMEITHEGQYREVNLTIPAEVINLVQLVSKVASKGSE